MFIWATSCRWNMLKLFRGKMQKKTLFSASSVQVCLPAYRKCNCASSIGVSLGLLVLPLVDVIEVVVGEPQHLLDSGEQQDVAVLVQVQLLAVVLHRHDAGHGDPQEQVQLLHLPLDVVTVVHLLQILAHMLARLVHLGHEHQLGNTHQIDHAPNFT
uniref:Uncharacterized protein n=1 Tax=Anguilla anguilla TaxID=7936 RepID=A0A0E9XUA6_ANGAN